MKDEIPKYMTQPFRVCHENGDVIAGFDDLASAKDDATERNDRAEEMGLSARYVAIRKSQP